MKRILIGSIIVIVLLAAVGLVGPGILGGQAEPRLRDALKTMSVPGFYKVEITSFESGWFSSKAESKFVLDGEFAKSYEENLAELGMPAQDFEVTFVHDIKHGPLALTEDGPKLVAAYAETDLDLPPLYQLILADYLKGKAFLTLNTSFGFGGGSFSRVSNPTYDETLPDGTDIRWDGIKGWISSNGDQVETDLSFPLLKVNSPDGGLTITGTRYSSDHVNHSTHVSLGKSVLLFPEIRGTAEDGPFSFDDVTYTSETALDDANHLSGAVILAISKGSFSGGKLGENSYEIRIEGIPAEAIDAVYDGYYQLLGTYADEAAMKAQLETLMSETFPQLFDGPFKLTVALDVDAEADEETLVGRTELTIGGAESKISATLDQSVEKVVFPDLQLTDSAAKVTLSGLDGEMLYDIYGDLVEIATMDLPAWQIDEEIDLLMEARLPQIIGADTSLSLDNLALNMPEGTATASGSAGFSGSGPITLENPAALIGRLQGGVSARIEEAALVSFMARDKIEELRGSFAEAGREISDELLNKLASDAARGEISALQAQAFIKRDNGAYTIDVEFRDGMLILNGIERPDLMGQ